MGYNHDWKTSMDELVELSNHAWFGPTKNEDRPKGLSVSVSLGKPKKKPSTNKAHCQTKKNT